MPFSFIPFMLLVIPLLEIATFVVIGGQIGVFPTLALIIVTAIIGSILLRVQGGGLVSRIQHDLNANKVPARELVHGLMIAIAGVLLLTPGFVTDTCGFLLFIPQLRDLAWNFVKKRIQFTKFGNAQQQPNSNRPSTSGETIDLSEEDYQRAPDPDSPWSDDKSEKPKSE